MVDVSDGTAVCPDYRAVDPLQHVRVATTVGKGSQHRVEDPRHRPAAELLPDGVRLAEIPRQIPLPRPRYPTPVRAIQNMPSSTRRCAFAGRRVEKVRKGSKNAHSSSDIRPHNTANLLGRGWLRITRRRVGGNPLFSGLSRGPSSPKSTARSPTPPKPHPSASSTRWHCW